MFAAIPYLVACAACAVLLLTLAAYLGMDKYSISRPYWHSLQTALEKAGRCTSTSPSHLSAMAALKNPWDNALIRHNRFR